MNLEYLKYHNMLEASLNSDEEETEIEDEDNDVIIEDEDDDEETMIIEDEDEDVVIEDDDDTEIIVEENDDNVIPENTKISAVNSADSLEEEERHKREIEERRLERVKMLRAKYSVEEDEDNESLEERAIRARRERLARIAERDNHNNEERRNIPPYRRRDRAESKDKVSLADAPMKEAVIESNEEEDSEKTKIALQKIMKNMSEYYEGAIKKDVVDYGNEKSVRKAPDATEPDEIIYKKAVSANDNVILPLAVMFGFMSIAFGMFFMMRTNGYIVSNVGKAGFKVPTDGVDAFVTALLKGEGGVLTLSPFYSISVWSFVYVFLTVWVVGIINMIGTSEKRKNRVGREQGNAKFTSGRDIAKYVNEFME